MARKSNNALFDLLADARFDIAAIVPELMRQPLPLQEKFIELVVAYVRSMALWYEYGHTPNGTENIAVLCKRMNDCGLDHFGRVPTYGLEDMPKTDLSGFDR